jgi:aspartokinase/homoserine dehydrogenase 1
MKVMKYGGTSVGSVEAIKQVGAIVREQAQKEKLIVVVSAMSGVTNQLTDISNKASQRDKGYESDLELLRLAHHKTYADLMNKPDGLFINHIFHNLSEVCHGVYLLKELTDRTSDYIVSCGERLSSYIVSSYFDQIELDSALFDSREFIITDQKFRNANLLWAETNKRLHSIKKWPQVALFPGFVSSTLEKETSTLGRGGSDFTAALLAKILKADQLEIWTDVNGLMTADPRLVKKSNLLEHVSYEEALELSHFGAKVLYPPSIQPALEAQIPILIKNTFDPKGPQTLVTKEMSENSKTIKGISSIRSIALLTLSGSSMVGIPSFSSRLFKSLSDAKINVILITQASSEHAICVGVATEDVKMAKKAVKEEFFTEIELAKIDEIDVQNDLSIVALVGSNMKDQVGVSGKMFHTLGANGISIKAIAQGSSERNISAVIHQTDLKKALNALHESFFLSERKRIHLYIIGVGNVGGAFLSQILKQQNMLAREFKADIRVVGIANSKKYIFDEEGLDLSQWKSSLKEGAHYQVNDFVRLMKQSNLRNSVFIDITASETISETYLTLLESSISVITPNKIAATRSMGEYLDLKHAMKQYGAMFLFETNVAAGLPVISTLNDLYKSGDKIHSIQAVLSGTLNYLFNEYNGTRPFVDIIKEAKSLGLTEPDPRLDLSGADVMRKLLILIRESGRKFELDRIKQDSFLPSSCEEAIDLEDFYEKVTENEDHFQKIYQEAKKEGAQLRVVASYSQGKATVGLEKVLKDHPFYFLEGMDNIVLFYTDRYQKQPLVIKGAGAGADVTASGIFADVLRLAHR